MPHLNNSQSLDPNSSHTYTPALQPMAQVTGMAMNALGICDQGQAILGIPGYDMPSYYPHSTHSLSMPNPANMNSSGDLVHDPPLSGSHMGGQLQNPPASFTQFASALPTTFGQLAAQISPPTQIPPPPLQPVAPAAQRGRKKRGGTAVPRQPIDDTFRQDTTFQLQQLGTQFRAVADSVNAIQAWMQAPQQSPATQIPQQTANTQTLVSPTVTQIPAASGSTGAVVLPATTNHVPIGNNMNSDMGNNTQSGNSGQGLTQQQDSLPGNAGSLTNTLSQSINTSPTTYLQPMLGHTYTMAGSGPRMSTGFPSNFDLNFRQGHGGNHQGNQPFSLSGYTEPSRRGYTVPHSNCITNVSASNQNSLYGMHVGSSIQEGGTGPSMLITGYQDLSSGFNHGNSFSGVKNCNNVDMTALLLPKSARTAGSLMGNTHSFMASDFAFEKNPSFYALPNEGRREERKIVSGGMPLGWNVADEIKQAIWDDVYIDFADLLDNEGTVKKALSDADPNMLQNQSKPKRQIRTIRDWDKAFSTYLNLYVRKPGNLRHLPHLITYANDLKTMAENGINFLEYDEKFRKERASQACAGIEPWGWNVFRQDNYNNLQLQAIAEKLHLSARKWLEFPRPVSYAQNWHQQFNTPYQPRRFTNTNQRLPFGFCFDFHMSGKRCLKNPCPFRHYCPCGRGPHPVFLCRSYGATVTRRDSFIQAGRGRRPDAHPPRHF